MRAALDELVREGYLVRRHGAGTFVSEPKIAQELTMTSFTDDMRSRGLRPASRTLELRVAPAGARLDGSCTSRPPSPSRSCGDCGLQTRKRWRSRRSTSASRSFPGLTGRDLEQGSFYEVLRERYGIVVAGGTQTIEPTVTNEEESAALGVPLHSPAFLFERVSRDEDGQIVEFVESTYRGDRYRLVTELGRRRDGPWAARRAHGPGRRPLGPLTLTHWTRCATLRAWQLV